MKYLNVLRNACGMKYQVVVFFLGGEPVLKKQKDRVQAVR